MLFDNDAQNFCVTGILYGKSNKAIYKALKSFLIDNGKEIPTERTCRNWIHQTREELINLGYDIRKTYSEEEVIDIYNKFENPHRKHIPKTDVMQKILDNLIPDGKMHSLTEMITKLSDDFTKEQVKYAFPKLKISTRGSKRISDFQSTQDKYINPVDPRYSLSQKTTQYCFLTTNITSFSEISEMERTDGIGFYTFLQFDPDIKLICFQAPHQQIHIYPVKELNETIFTTSLTKEFQFQEDGLWRRNKKKKLAYWVFSNKETIEEYKLEEWAKCQPYEVQFIDKDANIYL